MFSHTLCLKVAHLLRPMGYFLFRRNVLHSIWVSLSVLWGCNSANTAVDTMHQEITNCEYTLYKHTNGFRRKRSRVLKNSKQNVIKGLFGRKYWVQKEKKPPRHSSGKKVKKLLLQWRIKNYEIIIAIKIFNPWARTVPSVFLSLFEHR